MDYIALFFLFLTIILAYYIKKNVFRVDKIKYNLQIGENLKITETLILEFLNKLWIIYVSLFITPLFLLLLLIDLYYAKKNKKIVYYYICIGIFFIIHIIFSLSKWISLDVLALEISNIILIVWIYGLPSKIEEVLENIKEKMFLMK